jgi:hypothetical protein
MKERNIYEDLWPWHININITVVNIKHRFVFYLKQDVSETLRYLSLKVAHTQLGPDRDWLSLLGPTEYIPPESGNIDIPKRNILNKRDDNG